MVENKIKSNINMENFKLGEHINVENIDGVFYKLIPDNGYVLKFIDGIKTDKKDKTFNSAIDTKEYFFLYQAIKI